MPLGELESLLQTFLGRLLVLRLTDRLDHRIEIVERDLETFEEVGALPSAVELVTGAPGQHLAAMVDVVLEQRLEVEHDRAAVHQRQRDHAEGGLQRRVLVEVVEDR